MVCTGNICRSPMAERLLAAHAARFGADVDVRSAGVRAVVGNPAEPEAVTVMARRSIDLADHVARQITPGLLDGADLVLTMEGAHVVELVSSSPERFGRVFALREFVQRCGDVAPRRNGDTGEWLELVGAGRSARSLIGRSNIDVADPIGKSVGKFEQCADELDDLCSTVAVALWA